MFVKISILLKKFQLYYPTNDRNGYRRDYGNAGEYHGHLQNYGEHVVNFHSSQWQQPVENFRSPDVAYNGDGNVGDIQPEVGPIQSAGEAQMNF